MLIEILPGVFYDSEKEWYEQPDELVGLAEATMQNEPQAKEEESSGAKKRFIWAEWQTTTSEGLFLMKVSFSWVYGISKGAYLSRASHDIVSITKLS